MTAEVSTTMGNVRTTPTLTADGGVDGGLTPDGFRAACRKGTLSATGQGERYGVNAPGSTWAEYGSGARASGIRVVMGDTDGKVWESVIVALRAPDGPSVERINRLVAELNDGHEGTLKVETYWRTKSLMARIPGKRGRIALPAVLEATRSAATGGYVWRVLTAESAALAAANPTVAAAVVAPTAPASAPVTPPVKPAPVKRARKVAPVKGKRAAITTADPGMGHGTGEHPSTVVVEPAVVAPVAVPTPSAPALKRAPGLFREPGTLKPGFKVYHDPAVDARLSRAVARHRSGERTVVLISGPTGVGKTLTAQAVAHREGLPFLKVDAAGMVTFADWAGAVTLDESATGIVTRYAPSVVVEAVRADGPYAGIPRMVLVDEVNRVSGTSALNALMPLTDGSGTLYVPDARTAIPVDPAVIWVLTANLGSQYAGTATLDAALRNRVTSNIEVGYPSPRDEARMLTEQGGCSLPVAEALVKVATQVRAISASGKIAAPGVSTRQLISAAAEVRFGATALEGALTAFVDAYDGEGGNASERATVLVAATAILQGV